MQSKNIRLALVSGLILPFFVAPAMAAATPYTPTLSDCSSSIKLPPDWASKLVVRIKALNPAANPTSTWAITLNQTSVINTEYSLYFWASPNKTKTPLTSRSMWYTHDPTDPRKIQFNIDSSKGDVYRIPIGVTENGDGLFNQGGTYYDVAWAKTQQTLVSCAILNNRTPITDFASPAYWDLSHTAPVIQDVNLGFYNPSTEPSGGTTPSTVTVTGGLTKDDAIDLGTKGLAVLLTGFIAYLIINQFRWRGYD